jgi:hypothetical protein
MMDLQVRAMAKAGVKSGFVVSSLVLSLVLSLSLSISGWTLAAGHSSLPQGYPQVGYAVVITNIDTNTYEVMASGLRYKVTRAAKIVNTDMKRIFLFQIATGAPAWFVKDDKGVVVEIWLLPKDYVVEGY